MSKVRGEPFPRTAAHNMTFKDVARNVEVRCCGAQGCILLRAKQVHTFYSVVNSESSALHIYAAPAAGFNRVTTGFVTDFFQFGTAGLQALFALCYPAHLFVAALLKGLHCIQLCRPVAERRHACCADVPHEAGAAV